MQSQFVFVLFALQGNSGIVHAGFDDTPNTNRSKFCWPGNQMFADLDRDLHFGYQKNGSLVLATNEEEKQHLQVLYDRGVTNGVKNLRIIDKKELFKLEPAVNPNCIAALHSPDAGNLIPYEYTIAAMENAVDNGVEVRIRRQVEHINACPTFDNDGEFEVIAKYWEPSSYVKACGGVDKVRKDLLKGTSTFAQVIAQFIWISVVLGGLSGLGTEYGLLPHVMARPEIQKLMAQVDQEYAFVVDNAQLIITAVVGLFMMLDTLRSFQTNEGSGRKAAEVKKDSVGTGGSKVSIDDMKVGGSGSCNVMNGEAVATETYRSKYVINCAGSYSDKIANMIGDHSFKIKPRLGDYLLMNRNQGHLANHTLFPCPGKYGKGVLVQTTLWGNLILGPTARDVHNEEHMAQSITDVTKDILKKCRQLVPSFDPKEVIHAFCGARAKSDRGDWIIEASEVHPRFINVAGIDSPGLAGSPAIAVEAVRLLTEGGLILKPNPSFNPKRAPIIVPKVGFKALAPDGTLKAIKAGPVGKYTDPNENIVCKCEKVTEAEIVTAIHRGLPVDSTQAMRKRTRGGMGHCQAEKENYNCECRIANIIARELKYDHEDKVGRRPWPATSSLPQRWITDEHKEKFHELWASVGQ